MDCTHVLFTVLIHFCYFLRISAVELTFELPDNAKECFYQEIAMDTSATVEYQVISGGRYDVDCRIEDPDGLELYDRKKQQYDAFEWTTQKHGDYKICFSNEFSTITHKIVYFDLEFEQESPLVPEMAKVETLSQMETSLVATHRTVSNVLDYQTKFRLREATGRIFAQNLNEKVQVWSVFQMIILLIVALGQVIILRSFFRDRRARV